MCDAIDVWRVQTSKYERVKNCFEHPYLKQAKNMFLLFLKQLSSILMTCMHTLGISIAIVVASKEKSEKQKFPVFFAAIFVSS